MTSIDTAATPSTPETALPRARRIAPILFATTLFVSALLLFIIQPMFTKMVLPKVGGAPSVWSVAMVSFQGFLFIGYVYAHVMTRTLTPTLAAIVHLLLLAFVAMTLPLGIAKGFSAPPADGVMLWLVAVFAVSIGLPFTALSATAPLLQSWFAATGHTQGRNPYALSAASNLGSFCALIAYPFAVEPFLTLHTQRIVWSIGFSVLALLIAAAAFVDGPKGHNTVQPEVALSAPSTIGKRLSWILLMAIPAGLLMIGYVYASDNHTQQGFYLQIGLLAGAALLWGLAGWHGEKIGRSPNVGIAAGVWSSMVSALMAVAVVLARIDLINPLPQSADPWKQYQGLAIGNQTIQSLVHSLNMGTGFLLICPLVGGLLGLLFAMAAQD